MLMHDVKRVFKGGLQILQPWLLEEQIDVGAATDSRERSEEAPLHLWSSFRLDGL